MHRARVAKARLVANEPLAADIRRLLLKPARPIDFSPGQYAQLAFTPMHARPYSMAGLPGDARAHVFERFYSTKREGMGMGLAIARSIVEAHAGTIDVENADGGGARFWFRIPAHKGAEPASSA